MLHFVVKTHNNIKFLVRDACILLKREAGSSPARSRHCNREFYRYVTVQRMGRPIKC